LGKKLRAEQPLTRPYLRVANVQRGLLDLTNVKQVRVSEVDADKYSLVVGDVLMNEGGDRDKLGRGWIWNDEIQGCLYQNHVYRVRLRDRKFPPAFISMYANELGSEYFMSVATQTTNLASINKRSLSAFPMIIPTAAEASEALKIIRKCRDQVSRLQSVIQESEASLGQLERRIFVAAFRGELVSRVAGDDTVDLTVNEPLRRRTATMTKKIRPGLDDVHRSTDTWPVGGLSFQELMSGTAGGYEVVKDAIFAKLSGPEPELEQRYSEADGVMRFYRRAR
jgi:type I restriction enzyme S subunit